MELKKILWPTDFSNAASVAESYLKELTKKFDAEIYLLHVAQDLTLFEHYWGSGPDAKHIEELHKYGMAIANERLANLCATKLTDCPRYHIHIALGDPASEILKMIKEIEPDLVIMATHGMAANFPFGSVAEKVIKNSPVPVLSINPKPRE